MSTPIPTIIAKPRALTANEWRVFWAVLAGAAALGAAAAVFYAFHGLTLSHYDARGHLVVSRRIVDSLTPGWRQIGAVWLPLPHLVNALPAQLDWNFRTGYLSAALSVAALACGLSSIAVFLYRRTRSIEVAIAAAALVLLNPNVLYLQSTPMTEALLFGASGVALLAVDNWLEHNSPTRRWQAGLALMALALVRYEGWCIAAALVAVSSALAHLSGRKLGSSFALAPFLVAAIAAFLLLSWGSTGRWFVASGFFVPDPHLRHHLGVVITEIGRATAGLGGYVLIGAAGAGAVRCLLAAQRDRRILLALALATTCLLPLAAFYEGHPVRVRYMVPLIVAFGTIAAVSLTLVPRAFRKIAGLALLVTVAAERPPFADDAPMVVEAQWETPFRLERRGVLAVLGREHDGTPILASMGSLGHFMQESSEAHLALADFVHEGNGDLWTYTVAAPARHVRWVLIEEQAEGGDVLAERARGDASFLSGFQRIAEGGGLALYRRR